MATSKKAAWASSSIPEIRLKAVRPQWSARDRLRILAADACQPGDLGALLRREGIYSSHLSRVSRNPETSRRITFRWSGRAPHTR